MEYDDKKIRWNKCGKSKSSINVDRKWYEERLCDKWKINNNEREGDIWEER
jgi:hypothetical protein